MAQLDATKERGWSYKVGYSQDMRMYLARAIRILDRPRTCPIYRTREYFDVLSACGRDIEEAASRCARKVVWREAHPKWSDPLWEQEDAR